MTIGSALTTNIINNGLLIGIALLAFLVLKEIFTTDINKNKRIKRFITIINITLVPLIVIFLIIMAYNVNTALSNL